MVIHYEEALYQVYAPLPLPQLPIVTINQFPQCIRLQRNGSHLQLVLCELEDLAVSSDVIK